MKSQPQPSCSRSPIPGFDPGDRSTTFTEGQERPQVDAPLLTTPTPTMGTR